MRPVDPESALTFSPTLWMLATMADPAELAIDPAADLMEPERVCLLWSAGTGGADEPSSAAAWRLVWIVPFSGRSNRSCLELVRWMLESELLFGPLRNDESLFQNKIVVL